MELLGRYAPSIVLAEHTELRTHVRAVAYGCGIAEQTPVQRHRELLVEQYRVIVEAYDKAILALGGGALAVSFAFIRDVAPHPRHTNLLLASWIVLGASVAIIVCSFLVSQLLYRSMIVAMDTGASAKYESRFGTAGLFMSIAGGSTLIAGVTMLGFFVWTNLG